MKAIINTSNLVIGGAKQVAHSFLHEINNMNSPIEFHVFLSAQMAEEINQNEFSANFIFYSITNKPKPFFFGKDARNELDSLEAQIQPGFVFSVFGPVYWRPKSKHIAGFAAGWAINPTSIAYSVLKFKTKLKTKFSNWVKLRYVNQPEADHYIVEAKTVKNLLAKHSKIQLSQIDVVSNTFGDQYNLESKPNETIQQLGLDEYFKFITISANYSHKNLISIKHLIPLIRKEKLKVKFFVTLSPANYKDLFAGLENEIINLGIIKVIDCPSYYKACDALFLPTLLESFTASYPEAMKMGIPILTSDLDFAHDICGEAAMYTNTLDTYETFEKMKLLINNSSLKKILVEKGYQQLIHFDNAKQRAEKYLSISMNQLKR